MPQRALFRPSNTAGRGGSGQSGGESGGCGRAGGIALNPEPFHVTVLKGTVDGTLKRTLLCTSCNRP